MTKSIGKLRIEQDASLAKEHWRKALLPVDATLRQAIHSLDESAVQIVMVVSSDGALLGTLTDGDIRRGLLRGFDMDSVVDSLIHREPLVVPPQLSRDTVLQLMRANKVRQLPVVDEARQVVGLHVWDELMAPIPRPNLMVIMAGGQGTRLRPYTETCPKPMLPVGGKPMLEHIIERARGEGFQRFVLTTHYLGHMVENYFGDGSRWHVSIDYVREESPLGTSGALGLLDPKPDVPFIVTNGDVLTDIHYGELLDFHCHHGASATMAVRQHEWQHPFGVVQTNGVDIVGFEEKPIIKSHINAGVYALESEALNFLSAGEYCDMPTLFSRLQGQGHRTVVYPMHEPWLDVGRIDDYDAANNKAAM